MSDFSFITDLLRGKLFVPSLAAMTKVVNAILGSPGIVIVKVKNRVKTLGDVMIKLFMQADVHRHIAELQVELKLVDTAREDAGGHDSYGVYRSVQARLEATDVSTPKVTPDLITYSHSFSHSFSHSRNHLITLFFHSIAKSRIHNA